MLRQSATCATYPASVIVFKTAAGRIVKFKEVGTSGSALLGIYEVSDLTGVWPY